MTRSTAIIIMLSAALTISVFAHAAPRELTPEPGNLEGSWLFRTDPAETGEKDGWAAPACDDSGWRTLQAPGYWEAQGITDPRPGQPPKPLTGGAAYTDYDGIAWYRLHFVAPADWAGQNLLLTLGSVDDGDRTFLNGELVGETPGPNPPPNAPPSVSILRSYKVPAALLKPGAENVIAVRVFDGGGPGGIMGPMLSLIPEKVMAEMKKLPQSDRPLAQRFADPPASNRIIKIIHSWPDDAVSQDTLIAGLISQGFGGVVSNCSFTDYLESPAKWQAYVRAMTEAKQAGMSLWLYDERGYPSGAAGGLTMEGKLMPANNPRTGEPSDKTPPPPALHPEWEAQGLLIADAETTGKPVSVKLPPGKLVLAAAYPVTKGDVAWQRPTDLSAQVADGKLDWQPPDGTWRVMVVTQDRLYEGTHSAVSLGDRLPYINLLMPEATAGFLKVTHERYAEHLGPDLGKYLVSTFTDEPSLMSLFIAPMPYRCLPWAPALPTEFKARRGYAIDPIIPALVADDGPTGRKARYDFWLTIGELVSENYFGQIQTWCHQHNILSGGHLLMEEELLNHTPLYGDLFRCARRLDASSIDCLTSNPPEVPWFSARLLCSAGELEGHTVSMCETSDFAQFYRPPGDKREPRNVTEAEIRGTCNRLMVGGINTITSYYTWGGLSATQLRRVNNWVGRCSTMLRGGHQVADIALLYPTESIWPRYTPARQGGTDAPFAQQVQQAYFSATDSLFAAGREFCYVDSRALIEAKPTDGALAHGNLRWRVLVLPSADTMPLAAWENVRRFWQSGGAVVALDCLPANSEKDFPSKAVQALAQEIFGRGEAAGFQANANGGVGVFLPVGSEQLLPSVLDSLIGRDLDVSAKASPLRVTHRQVDGSEVYFVINDSAAKFAGVISLGVTGAGEQCDPANGKMTALNSGDRIAVSFEPYGGMLFRFAQAKAPRRLKVASGALPGLTMKPLPACEPVVGGGEFVKKELLADAEHSRPDDPAWTISGTITKTKVDTHEWAVFNYDKPVDLGDMDCLVVQTWAPEGQTTPAQLIVMVIDQDGEVYYTEVGRGLGAPGRRQAFLPKTRFQPGPWVKQPKSELAWDRIAHIQVGWGGYLGTEGEKVEFSLTLPQMGKTGK